jgi:hypothetical protein
MYGMENSWKQYWVSRCWSGKKAEYSIPSHKVRKENSNKKENGSCDVVPNDESGRKW